MPSATAAASFIGCTKAYLPQHMAGEASTMKWNAFLNKIIHLGSHWSHLSLVSKLQACFNVKDRMLILWGTFSLIKNPFCWMFKTLQTWIPWKGHQLDFLQDFTPGPQNTPAKNDQRLMFYCSIYFINRFTMICYVLPYFTSFSPYFTNGLTFCWHHQLSSAGPPRRFRHPQHRWPPFWWQSWARRESCALHRLWGGKWWNIGYHMDAIWHMIYLGIGIHISHVPSFDMAYGIHLMIFDDIWCYLMLFDDIWWYLKIFDDIWYRMI